jgi:signal transduction histidine kinase/ligand-binding sensor domain-containing protein/DNA-binding response OmpR family regulator
MRWFAFVQHKVLDVFIFLLIVFFGTALNGQSPELKYLGIEKGLSNNSVRCIYQDHNGFMWFGTYDGLNRYDGYEFEVFRNKPGDSTSLPYNYINVIAEDHNKNLWVGTGQGIGIFNSQSAKWEPAFYFPYGSTVKQKISDNINHIEKDAAGNLFIATNGSGLFVKQINTPEAIQIPIVKDGKNSIQYVVQSLRAGKNERVWIFIEEFGLCLYDPASKKIQLVNNGLKSVQCMEISNDSLWIGTKNGLYFYSVSDNKFSQKNGSSFSFLNSNNVTSLLLDQQHRMWIGTEGDGVKIINTISGEVNSIQPGDDRNNITSGQVNAIFEDRESRKWIGTLKGGINIIDPANTKFRIIARKPGNQNSLVNDYVYSFFEDKNKNLWIGTDGGGFSIWNRKQNSFTNYSHKENNDRSLSNNSVTSILQDHLGSTWIATYGGGINKFNPSSGTFEQYSCVNDVTGEQNKIVLVLYEDIDKNLWAGTFTNGKLFRFNRRTNKFEVFDQLLNNILAITEDRSGNLWVGNSHQLIKVDKQREQHLIFTLSKPVRAIHEDKKGNFWVGIEGGGLIQFDIASGKIIQQYSVEDGLCNNSVLKILEDDEGQLWISTFNGLSRFNPADKTFKNYYQSDGLQSNQFLFRAGLRLQSGEFVFGGIKGFNIFYPGKIQPRNYMPPVVLSNLRINGNPVSDDYDYVEKIIGDKIQSLRIPYDEAVLSIDFAALEFSSPERIQYAYYLEGWDKDWNYSRNSRTANYTNLREGTYSLRIKATNAEGEWNNEERIIKIIVLPPWYRTIWAYLLYTLLIGSLVYLYLRYKTSQTRLKYEVKLAHLQAEKEKELNEKKLSFFTDVSHEFRTPLTLIINPLKDYITHPEKRKEEKGLQVVYRNARRLLSLVDQLLLFQKADADREELKIAKLDFTQLCRDVYGNFEIGAKTKKLDYEFAAGSEHIELYADREKMEIILYNLLSNALKYTPEGGKILFSVHEMDNGVEVFIEDNGPGIPEEVGNRLFERFYQGADTKTASKPGFGIGLYLVKHFVDKHKGTINYQNSESGGASFHLHFLKGSEHFGSQRIMQQSPEKTLLPELLEEEVIVENVPVSVAGELPELVSDKNSLLVVEDDKDIREYVAGIFREEYTVYEAKSGEEGLKIAREILPDIIISDVMMQNGTGLQLCETIKKDPVTGHIPVILLTAVSNSEIKLQGVEGGADDYITKPFEKDFLVARVKSLLKSRTALQQYFYNEVTLRKTDQKISPEYREFLENCIRIVEAHLEDDDFNIKKLTQEIGMSHSNLYKKVKAISGQSVTAFIRYLRVRKAAELMIKQGMNVNEASFQVGISDVKYFRKQFQKLFGMNPSDYIKKYRSGFEDSYSLNRKLPK